MSDCNMKDLLITAQLLDQEGQKSSRYNLELLDLEINSSIGNLNNQSSSSPD